jgi:purine-binding chemotaxis protein CheW
MSLNEKAIHDLVTSINTKNNAGKVAKSDHIDWDLVHKRLTETSSRLVWVDDLTDEALQQVWNRRAAQLAQTLQEEEQGEQVEVAVIRLGRERYALEVQYIFDIRMEENITRVPRVPEWVAGVVNLRGQILSVVDLRRFLGLPASGKATEVGAGHLLLVQTSQMELAFLVDEVLRIQNLSTRRIQEAASVVRGLPMEYVQGVYIGNEAGDEKGTSEGSENPSLLIILNIAALLADKNLVIQEEII